MIDTKIIVTYILLSSAMISSVFGQCIDETHSTNVGDSWESCIKSINPNSTRGNSHWVLYDLGNYYEIDGIKIWNYNVQGGTKKGIKNVVVDYSVDGINWNESTTILLSEAIGNSNYTGENVTNIDEIQVRYVLFTVLDTWGDVCAGLSEVRFNISGIVNDLNDVFADENEISLFPNPTEGVFVIQGLLDNYKIEILNSQGYLLKKLNSKYDQILIDIGDLPSGLFFVRIENKNNQNLFMQKIIKI